MNAVEEGVQFEWLTAPVKFIGDEAGRVKAAECIRMRLGEPDAKGRRSPTAAGRQSGRGFELCDPCDTVVLAIGYSPETDIPETTPNLKTTKWGSIVVASQETGETSREDLFAAGDNVRGADLVVTAVAAARKAAVTMHQKLLIMRAKREARTQSATTAAARLGSAL